MNTDYRLCTITISVSDPRTLGSGIFYFIPFLLIQTNRCLIHDETNKSFSIVFVVKRGLYYILSFFMFVIFKLIMFVNYRGASERLIFFFLLQRAIKNPGRVMRPGFSFLHHCYFSFFEEIKEIVFLVFEHFMKFNWKSDRFTTIHFLLQ